MYSHQQRHPLIQRKTEQEQQIGSDSLMSKDAALPVWRLGRFRNEGEGHPRTERSTKLKRQHPKARHVSAAEHCTPGRDALSSRRAEADRSGACRCCRRAAALQTPASCTLLQTHTAARRSRVVVALGRTRTGFGAVGDSSPRVGSEEQATVRGIDVSTRRSLFPPSAASTLSCSDRGVMSSYPMICKRWQTPLDPPLCMYASANDPSKEDDEDSGYDAPLDDVAGL